MNIKENRLRRLKEIRTALEEYRQLGYDTSNWLITELESAWKRVDGLETSIFMLNQELKSVREYSTANGLLFGISLIQQHCEEVLSEDSDE